MDRKEYMNMEKHIRFLHIMVNILIAISILHGLLLIWLQLPHLRLLLSTLKQLK